MDNRQLRAIGHRLKPVVTLGNSGLSEGVLNELNRALNDHELIKVKIAGDDREERAELVARMAEACSAEVVQQIGKTALLLRRNSRPNPRTSNLVRGLTA